MHAHTLNKRTNTWIYDLYDASTNKSGPVIDKKIHHNIFKVVCGSTQIHSYFDNVMTKFMINNRTDAWKTDVNLLLLYFLIPHSSFCPPPPPPQEFCTNYYREMLLRICRPPKGIPQQNWGAGRMNYGRLENRECYYCLQTCFELGALYKN